MATVVVESIDLLPDGRIDLTATVMAGGAARELSDPVIRLAPRGTPDEVLVAASVVEASQGRWAVGCSILAEVLARLDVVADGEVLRWWTLAALPLALATAAGFLLMIVTSRRFE